MKYIASIVSTVSSICLPCRSSVFLRSCLSPFGAPRCLALSPLLFLCLWFASSSLQAQPSNENTQSSVLQSRALVAELSNTHGRYDVRLIEPLAQLAGKLIEEEQYDESNRILDQAQQISRLNLGLFNQAQFSLQLLKIENYMNQDDWDGANELMEHLKWLLNREDNEVSSALVDSLIRLSELHLHAVILETELAPDVHLQEAIGLTTQSMILTSAVWGPVDLRLLPLLYKQALQFNMQLHIINHGGPGSLGIRSYGTSGAARPREVVGRQIYYQGLAHIDQIGFILQNQESPDLEAVALSKVYMGDWQVLFSYQDEAAAAYREANSMLLQANFEEERINRFFDAPRLLPIAEFYTSLDAAEFAASAQSSGRLASDSESPIDVNLIMQPWSSSFPHITSPFLLGESDSAAAQQSRNVRYEVKLSALDNIKGWRNGRYQSLISRPHDLVPLSVNLSPEAQEEIEEDLKEISFRPKLVDGVAQAIVTNLQYQLF